MDEKLHLINILGVGTFQETLGLTITSIDREKHTCVGEFMVKQELIQPMGLLNGGATAGVMETIGSILTTVFIDHTKEYNLGLSLTVNHIRGAKIGTELITKARMIHKGRKTHIIEITIKTKENKLISKGTLTNIILPLNNL